MYILDISYIQILSFHVPSIILPFISDILIFSHSPPNPPKSTWELPSFHWGHGLRSWRSCGLRHVRGAHRQPRLVEAHEIRSLRRGPPRLRWNVHGVEIDWGHPLVMTNITMGNGHGHSGSFHWTLWFSTAMLNYQGVTGGVASVMAVVPSRNPCGVVPIGDPHLFLDGSWKIPNEKGW